MSVNRAEVFNLDMLVKIDVYDRKKCKDFVYRIFEKKYEGFKTIKGIWNYFYRTFWWRNKMAGFYSDGEFFYSDDAIQNGKYCGVPLLVSYDPYPCVYFRPYVRLSFAGGYEKIKEFDTYKEAVLFANIQEASIKNKITFLQDDIQKV